MKLKYGVIGLRHNEGLEFDNYGYIKSVLDQYQLNMDRLVSGGARGIETLAERWAKEADMPFCKIKPQVTMFSEHVPEHPKAIEAAFTTRNTEILHLVDILVVFWNGREHMVLAAAAIANKVGKPVFIYPLQLVD